VWLLLHGVPLSLGIWDDVRRHLAGDTVAPDLNEAIGSVPRDGLLQQQVAAKISADMSEGDLAVVGHSFGGQVALELALAAPQRLRRLIIVCSRHTPFPAFELGARAVRAGEPVDIDAGMRRWFTPAELAADGPAVRYARRRVARAAAAVVSPPAVMAELAVALPAAVLEVVDDWAHMSPFANPAAFAARLTAAATYS
jgi:pimeloyl-ACP methyl ester carboxylesterase